MRDVRDAIHSLDDQFLLNKFKAAAEFSMDDEFIQILLAEIKNRKLSIEEVLRELELN